MSFRAIADELKQEKWKSRGNGEAEGMVIQTYFQRRAVAARLKERCRREGISVSRFLSRLAEKTLEADE